MIKRISLATLFILILLPYNVFADVVTTTEPHDYNNGLLDDEYFLSNVKFNYSGHYDIDNKYQDVEKIYDNDLSFNSKLVFNSNTKLRLDFMIPIKNLKQMYLNFKEKYRFASFTIKVVSGEEYSFPIDKSFIEGYIDINQENVKSIIFTSSYIVDSYITEIELFGSYDSDVKEYHEVLNLKSEVDQDRVDLSWDLPDTERFHHVNIYRKSLSDTSTDLSFFQPIKVHAEEEHKPIFETNGTYFNDLTVEAATTYEYKLTTEYENIESPGVTIKATTSDPKIVDSDYKKNEKGDYVFSWKKPTSGKVVILVGGKEYATVSAESGSFTVPGKDMIYTFLGDPDVGLKPIAKNGTTGKIESVTGSLDDITLPFSVKDLILSGNNLLWIIGSFILLALSFWLVPKFIELIRNSLSANGASSDKSDKPYVTTQNIDYRQPRLTKRERRELSRYG